MNKITLETNGYEVSKEVVKNLRKWSYYIVKNFGKNIKSIKWFAYDEKLVFVDLYLNNGDYAIFDVTTKGIYLGSRSGSDEHCNIFKKATMNDSCFIGEII